MAYWRKIAKIGLRPINDCLLTHASNPMAIHLEKDIYRVFFSGRNIENKSSVGFIDIDILSHDVLTVCREESFRVSDNFEGFFSHGVSIGNMYNVGLHNYVLFMAWQIRDNNHWRGDIGRLELSNCKKHFSLVGKKPFLTVDSEDLVSLSYPWVLYDEGIYKMWYGSTVSWDSPNGEMIHVIKYATSSDGEVWVKHGLAIPYELGVAQAFSRPTVVKDNEGYHMWYSFRSGTGEKYRIGYAHSHDGLLWDRKSNSGIDVSEKGWDSEMICYPFVFDHGHSRYMLYNGNDFGKTGFGIAILET